MFFLAVPCQQNLLAFYPFLRVVLMNTVDSLRWASQVLSAAEPQWLFCILLVFFSQRSDFAGLLSRSSILGLPITCGNISMTSCLLIYKTYQVVVWLVKLQCHLGGILNDCILGKELNEVICQGLFSVFIIDSSVIVVVMEWQSWHVMFHCIKLSLDDCSALNFNVTSIC